ncbi:hypothetical protein [Flexivirga alba]|jgi:hypothetical protein|uniref:DUF485 domain-containing protein n=1 Tax=Flexivirga alba TaxID=702742 RepID=A0ABW2AHC3_9MICO
MTEPAERVRVQRRRSAAPDVAAMSEEIDAQSMLGEALLRSLMRTQLRLAAVVLVLLAVTLGSLPLIFDLLPGIRRLHVLGIPLPWLLLGVLVYPVLLGLGWFYVRYAERNEAGFVRLISADHSEPPIADR